MMLELSPGADITFRAVLNLLNMTLINYQIHPFYLNQVTQDVPRYIMVAGDRAELRGLNLEGLRRNGFTDQEVFNFLILVYY
jgi:acyl-[acyl carrier protein]--UDP-N-acetylglucosamine O-acyltransferase